MEERLVLSATHLAFEQQPTNTPVGVAIIPAITVEVLDASDQLVTTDDSTVSLSIGNNPAGGALAGTTSAQASGGIATFSGLSLSQAGTGYTLEAADGALTGTSSATFDVASSSVVTADGLEYLTTGAFTASGTTESTDGEVEVGFAPQSGASFFPLLGLDGSVSIDTGALSFSVDGSVSSLIDGSSTTLYDGSFSTSISSLLGGGVTGLSGSGLSVAGVTFTLGSLALTSSDASGDPAIELQGSIALPGGLTVGVDGGNDVVIDASGVSLTGVDASLSGTLSVGGVTFGSANLTASYSTSDNTFRITGDSSFTLDGSSVSVTFGTTADPQGLVIENGTITDLAMVVDSSLDVSGLTFATSGLDLTYVSASDELTMSGSTSFTLTGDTVSVTFGTTADPQGLVIQSGGVTSLAMVVDSSITVAGLSFSTSGLDLTYVSASDEFTMAGASSFTLDGESVSVTFGTSADPSGLVLQNGVVTSLDMVVDSSITVAGLAFATNGLDLTYASASDELTMTGAASFTLSGETVSVTFGTTADPDGLVIQGGAVTSLGMVVNSNLAAAGLTFSTSGLDLTYVSSSDEFTMTGSASFALGGTTVSVTFGTTASPQGLVIQNGSITSLAMVVNSSLSLAGLTFSTSGLDLTYVASSDEFTMAGATSFALAGNTVDVTFGTTSASEGLVIQNGAVTSLAMVVNSSITVAGLSFSTSGLDLTYVSSSDEFTMAGATSFALGGSTVSATFGTTADPDGLVIEDGAITSLDMAVTSNITVAGLSFSTSGLDLTYASASGEFTMAGSANFALAGDTVDVTFGTTADPQGLVIENGVVTTLDMVVNSSITVAGLAFSTSGLDLTYGSASDEFTMSGSASFTLGGSSVSVTFGTTADPQGLVIQNGAVTSLAMVVDSSITVAGLSFSTSGLDLTYVSASDEFTIAGSSSFSLAGDSVSVTFGTTADPDGLVIENGAITSLDMMVNSSLDVAGLTFSTSGLDLTYVSSSDEFTMTGSTSFALGGDTVSVTFGTTSAPQGLVIQDGSLTSLSLSVTSDLSIGGLTFATQGLTGSYTSSGEELTIVGDASLSFEGNSISVDFGGGSTSGLVIEQGEVASLSMVVNSQFSIDDLSFTANDLALDYTASSESFTMSGTASVSLFGDTLSADFGSGGSGSGLVITDGALTSLDVTASGTFSLFGLSIVASDMVVDLDTSASVYRFSGTISVSTASQADGSASYKALDGVTASLGSEAALKGDATPDGLVLENGEVTEFNLTLNGPLDLFGLDLSFSELALSYDSTSSDLVISGGAALSFGPFSSISVTVPDSGLTISTSTGDVHVSGLSIAFSVGLGGGESDEFGFDGSFSFSETDSGGDEVVSYSASGTVDTGEGDFGASMSLEHSGGKSSLKSVSISYSAGSSEGVDVDGLFVTSLGASISNIGSSKVTISGSIAADYGGSVDGATLFSASGSCTWTESTLTGEVSYKLAGGSNGAGSGTADLDLDFAKGTYGIKLSGTAYAGIFRFDLEFELYADSHLYLSGTADLNTSGLPSWVSSFMGGDKLSSLGFEFQYIPKDDSDSYGAAWLTIAGEEVGIRVNFKGHVTEIVSSGVGKAIMSLAHDATQVYDETATALAGAYQSAVSALGTGLSITAAQFTSYETSVANAATAAFNSAVAAAQTAYDATISYAESEYNSIVNQASSLFTSEATSEGMNAAIEDYDAALSDAEITYNYYLSYADAQYNSAVSDATSAYEAASSVIITASTSLVSAATSAVTTLDATSKQALSTAESAASSALGGLESAAESAIQDIEKAAEDVGKTVSNWFSSWGYLSGAVVFYDPTGRGVARPRERHVVTAADGSFRPTWPTRRARGALVVAGGVDTSTGLPNTQFSMAPANATMITPLTTLVSLLMGGRRRLSGRAANALVDHAFGVPTSVNLEHDNLIQMAVAGNANAARAFTAEVQLSAMVYLLDGLLSGSPRRVDSFTLSRKVFSGLAGFIGNHPDGLIGLTDASRARRVVEAVSRFGGVRLDPRTLDGVASIFATVSREFADIPFAPNATYLARLVQVQHVAEHTLAPLLGQTVAGTLGIGTLLASENRSTIHAQVVATKIGNLTPRVPQPLSPPPPASTVDLKISAISPVGTQRAGVPEVLAFKVRELGSTTAIGLSLSLDLRGIPGGSILSIATTHGSVTPVLGDPGRDVINLGTLEPGATASVSIVVVPQAPGELTARAAISCLQVDSNPSNNQDVSTAQVVLR